MLGCSDDVFGSTGAAAAVGVGGYQFYWGLDYILIINYIFFVVG